VLKDLETKNPTLLAAAKRAQAQKAAAHVGLLLDDPSVEAAYYWGDPSENGIRWDLRVSQSFEMPSVMVRRARLRDLQENAAEIDYQSLRVATMLETQQICADIIYYWNMAYIYDRRCTAAIKLAQLYRRRFETGECSILEYNRAQMNMADVQNKAARAIMEADHVMADLRQLMGDESYSFTQMEYDSVWSEPIFEVWYDQLEMRNPELQQLNNQLAISQQKEQLSRASWLPKVDVGYAAENVVGSTWRGATVGLKLPLWSQQRAVRAAKLQTAASQDALATKRFERFNKLRCVFHRHEALILNLNNLKAAYRQSNSLELLDKALEAGEINLEQYLQQVNYYYEIEMEIWNTAHQLEQFHLLLYSVEL
jgi:outer membrane protein TolC